MMMYSPLNATVSNLLAFQRHSIMELVTYVYICIFACLAYSHFVCKTHCPPATEILKIIFPSANDQLIIPAGPARIPSNRHPASTFLTLCVCDLPYIFAAYFYLDDGSKTFLRSFSIDA